jgi:hypothetical protein
MRKGTGMLTPSRRFLGGRWRETAFLEGLHLPPHAGKPHLEAMLAHRRPLTYAQAYAT